MERNYGTKAKAQIPAQIDKSAKKYRRRRQLETSYEKTEDNIKPYYQKAK